MIALHNLNPRPQPWYDDRPTDALVARLDVARLGAFRLGYVGVQKPDSDGPADGDATWEEGTDSVPPVNTRWTEGDDLK